jgi:hypothetical protein
LARRLVSVTFEEIEGGRATGESQALRSFFARPKETLSGWRDMIAEPIELHAVPDEQVDILLELNVKHLACQLASSIDKPSDLSQRRTR